MDEADRLEVCFEVALPDALRERVTDRLDAALRAANCGWITGAETFVEVQYSGIWCKLYVGVTRLETAVRALRHELQALEVGPGTWIVQYEPEEAWYEVWVDDANPPTWGW